MERKEVKYDYEEGNVEPVTRVSNHLPKLTEADLEAMRQGFIYEYVMEGKI